MKGTISIVTPSFDQGRFIERTIRSVLDQGVRDVEYVVCDGGSTDHTVNILRQYEHRLRWVSEKDAGQADAVNKGFSMTRGDLVGWLNSDDIYYPGTLRAVMDFSEANPEVDVIYGDANHVDENDVVIEPYPTEDWDFERLKTVCFICQPGVFVTRRVLDRYGGLDETLQYCMDYEYWLRLGLKNAKFAHLPRVLAGSRLYAQNKTLSCRLKVHAEINAMMRELLGEVPDKWIYNYAHASLDDRGWLRSARRRYAIGVAAVTLYAALKWNHKVRRSVLRTVANWVGGALK
jgi:glycosyltransferase involved in cell wall biosynthesis